MSAHLMDVSSTWTAFCRRVGLRRAPVDGTVRFWPPGLVCGALILLGLPSAPVAAQDASYEPPMPRVAHQPLVPVVQPADPDRALAMGVPLARFRHLERARSPEGRLLRCVDGDISRLAAVADSSERGHRLRVEVRDSLGAPTPASVFLYLDNPRTDCTLLTTNEAGVLTADLLKPRRNLTVEVSAPGHRTATARLAGASRALQDERLVVQLEAADLEAKH